MKSVIRQWCLYSFLLVIPVAQSAEPTVYNRIAFSEQAHVEVENDTLVAVMFVQKEGTQPDRLAQAVNQIVSRALAQVKHLPQLKVRTLSYRTQPVYHKQSIKSWRVQQSIQLESKNSQLLGEKIGELQAMLSVQSISYQVSEERQREYRHALVTKALQRFQNQAAVIAESFEKKTYRLVQLSIHHGDAMPFHKVMRDNAMMAEMQSRAYTPVSLEAGTQRLTVTIQGEIELTP